MTAWTVRIFASAKSTESLIDVVFREWEIGHQGPVHPRVMALLRCLEELRDE